MLLLAKVVQWNLEVEIHKVTNIIAHVSVPMVSIMLPQCIPEFSCEKLGKAKNFNLHCFSVNRIITFLV